LGLPAFFSRHPWSSGIAQFFVRELRSHGLSFVAWFGFDQSPLGALVALRAFLAIIRLRRNRGTIWR